jgi:coenzyme Q-binding protein COQ10
MPTHAERRKVPYTAEQMYDLVVDVEKYPDFLPWCLECKITSGDGHVFFADLTIGYKMIRENFTSKVTALRPDHIHVEYVKGPMSYLSNHWCFIEQEDGTCIIDFFVDFEFKNPLMRKLMGLFFHEAVKRMARAFEVRAEKHYR